MSVSFSRSFLTLLTLACSLTLVAQQSAVREVSNQFIYTDAPFPSCHASTIAETPDGLVAAWFGGTHENNPDVEIWLSRRSNGKWSTPVSVADGVQHSGKRYPTWNPVLFQVPGGPLLLFYKVGKDVPTWWGEMKISKDNGKTWSDARRLPEDVQGPIKNKPFLTADGTLICPASTETNGWVVQMELTKDSGEYTPISRWETTGFASYQRDAYRGDLVRRRWQIMESIGVNRIT
jgi:hypothetical protein